MNRSRFQGVLNIFKFNWHFYAIALSIIFALFIIGYSLSGLPSTIVLCFAFLSLLSTIISILASYIAYDATGLYDLSWIAQWMPKKGTALNIHAGFDETTLLLRYSYPRLSWHALDFYDPAKHTEISIRRARACYPQQVGTLTVSTRLIPMDNASVDCFMLFLSAHEIRDHCERVDFFREIKRMLKNDGVIVVTEHIRDWENIVAYNIGAFHFHTHEEWLKTFSEAGLRINARKKLNPFITYFILQHT